MQKWKFYIEHGDQNCTRILHFCIEFGYRSFLHMQECRPILCKLQTQSQTWVLTIGHSFAFFICLKERIQ